MCCTGIYTCISKNKILYFIPHVYAAGSSECVVQEAQLNSWLRRGTIPRTVGANTTTIIIIIVAVFVLPVCVNNRLVKDDDVVGISNPNKSRV